MLCKLLSTAELSCFAHRVISLENKGELGSELESMGVPVYPVGLKVGMSNLEKALGLVKLIRQLKGDVWQGWLYRGNLAALFAGLLGKRKSKVLWNIMHSPNDLGLEKRGTVLAIRVGSLLSAFPCRIIYNGQASAEVHSGLGYRNARNAIIPTGFDLDRFKADPKQRQRLRSGLGLGDGSLLVGLIARYHPVKGHRLFLRAAGLLGRNYPDLHFVLVGPSGEAACAELGNWIREEGLDGRVHLLGERRDIPAIIAGLDIVVSASLTEAFPNVIGEAMACEVPCVVTDVGDCARLVGPTGVVVLPEPKSLAAGVAGLVEMTPDTRLRLGKAARARIQGHFSLPVIAKMYRDIYWQIVKERAEGAGPPPVEHGG